MNIQTSLQNPKNPTKIQINISEDKIIEAEILTIPLSQLKLDPNNVRFKHIPEPMTDKQIEDYIWKEPDTKSTLREIKFSQGLSEKPYVKKISDSEYLVIEGNRRTVCLRHLVEQIGNREESNIPLEKIDPVQCTVLPDDVDEAAIALLLARLHVSGKKDWPAMNKGAHIYDLVNKHDYDWDEVAKAVSMGKNTITQNVKAFDQTMEYHEKYPADKGWLQKFSQFLELYKRRSLKEWAENPKNLEKFMDWVNKNQIPMAIHVRKMDNILADRDALNAMEQGSTIPEAEEILKESEKRKSNSENADSQVKNLYGFVQNFPRNKMAEFAKNEDQLKSLETFHKEVGRLIKDIKAIGGL